MSFWNTIWLVLVSGSCLRPLLGAELTEAERSDIGILCSTVYLAFLLHRHYDNRKLSFGPFERRATLKS